MGILSWTYLSFIRSQMSRYNMVTKIDQKIILSNKDLVLPKKVCSIVLFSTLNLILLELLCG